MTTHRWSGALAATLLAACGGYGAPDEVVYGEAVYSQGKPGTDFRGFAGNYFLETTMIVVEDNTNTTQALPDAVVSAVEASMTALGWARVGAIGGAEVVLTPSLLKGTGEVYYPGYWCDYYTAYGCYYSWYYAGSYRFGSLILEMLRLPIPANDQAEVLWTSQVYGVATTPQVDVGRAAGGVSRAFAQSPYLDTRATP
jgi:hypothetical protein